MKVEVKVPSMGESITQATIGTIIKPSGSFVKEEDELIELETDKVNQVLYASGSGVIQWNVAKEDTVTIGQVLGFIDSNMKQALQGVETQVKVLPSTVNVTKNEEPPVVLKQSESLDVLPSVGSARLSKEDLIAELKSEPKSSLQEQKTEGKVTTFNESGERETRKKLSKIRKVIATRLVDALQNTAMLTTFNEVDMSKIMQLREQYKEEFIKIHQTKLGYMSFFIKASVSALKAFPEINAYIDGDDLVYRNYFDISVAVGTEKGVVVPVIRDCDKLSFSGIEGALEVFAKKARTGGLTANDFQGGGFTITNGGTYGSLLSTPILNMPQSGILGMHKIEKRAVVVDDSIVIRPMMYLALSYDHRVVDGKEAVSFLVHIKNMLEDPSRLLLEI